MRKDVISIIETKKEFMVIQIPDRENNFEIQDSFKFSNGAFIIGQEGELEISVNMKRFKVENNCLLTILPHHVIQGHSMSVDFKGYFILFTPAFAEDINLLKSNLPFMVQIRENPLVKLNENDFDIICKFCEFMHQVEENPIIDSDSFIEIRKYLLTAFLHTFGTIYRRYIPSEPVGKLTRANLIFKNFLSLLVEYYAQERSVSFYANKLCITPKYLGTICREVSKKLATDIIANAVILDAKAKLHKGDLSVQEISDSLNFPNASFFGRYFKRHTGYSPMQYRETLK